MKKYVAIVLLLLSGVVAAHAATETVYLKNGSVINGTVIEQIPGESLKIKTRDGNIFVFEMNDVAKISKTEPISYSFHGGPEKGYRGFVDVGYTIGVGTFNVGRMEVLTSHGYQICPYFFAGAGVGLNYYPDAEAVTVPIFADLRADILNNWITPFVDFKVGYTVVDVTGFYMSPSIGCRMGFGNNFGMHISVGYTMQKESWEYRGYYGYSSGTINYGGVSLRVGVEF